MLGVCTLVHIHTNTQQLTAGTGYLLCTAQLKHAKPGAFGLHTAPHSHIKPGAY